MPVSKERLQEIYDHVAKHGKEQTIQDFNISAETVGRYIRWAEEHQLKVNEATVLGQIREQFTDSELKALLKGGFNIHKELERPIPTFQGEHFRVGACSDLHIGSKSDHPAAAFGDFVLGHHIALLRAQILTGFNNFICNFSSLHFRPSLVCPDSAAGLYARVVL